MSTDSRNQGPATGRTVGYEREPERGFWESTRMLLLQDTRDTVPRGFSLMLYDIKMCSSLLVPDPYNLYNSYMFINICIL